MKIPVAEVDEARLSRPRAASFRRRTSAASARVDTPEEAAALLTAHWGLDGAGVVLAQPLPPELAMPAGEFEQAWLQAEQLAAAARVRGPAVTPFLLGRLAELTGGKTLQINQALILANARLAAQISGRFQKE